VPCVAATVTVKRRSCPATAGSALEISVVVVAAGSTTVADCAWLAA
jgi:hypothetical protein